MPHKIMYCPTFERNFKDFFKSYPKSIKSFLEYLRTETLLSQSDTIPKIFAGFNVRKIRFGLKEYKIGKRNGIRLLFVVLDDLEQIYPILMFKKGRYKQESKMFADAKYALKGILSEIKKNLCSDSIVILPLDK